MIFDHAFKDNYQRFSNKRNQDNYQRVFERRNEDKSYQRFFLLTKQRQLSTS